MAHKCQIRHQHFLTHRRHGSSDTWVARTGFQCFDIDTGAASPEADCRFGLLYTPGPDFEPIPNINFNITYGDKQFLIKTYSKVKVTIGGIS